MRLKWKQKNLEAKIAYRELQLAIETNKLDDATNGIQDFAIAFESHKFDDAKKVVENLTAKLSDPKRQEARTKYWKRITTEFESYKAQYENELKEKEQLSTLVQENEKKIAEYMTTISDQDEHIKGLEALLYN